MNCEYHNQEIKYFCAA